MEKDILDPIDPDTNIFNSVDLSSSHSPLLLPSTLSSYISSINPNLLFLHLNVRSLYNKMNQFSVFLTETTIQFSIIGITETWLDDISSSLISLPNYSFLFDNRKNRTGGGVGLFISNSLNFILRKDLCPDNPNFDWMAVEILSNFSANILVFVVYRPPNTDPFIFTNSLITSLNQKSIKNKLIYLLGDFNINILQNDVNNVSSNFSNIMSSINLIPLISHPTRITAHSSTLIDNIYTNNLQLHASAVLINNLSDHFPICTFLNLHLQPKPVHDTNKYTFTKSNLSALNTFLLNYDWSEVLRSVDVNYVSARLIEIIHHGLNSHCIFQIKHRSRRKQPWLTLGLLTSAKAKNKLYKKYLKYPTYANKSTYTKYKSYFTSLCNIVKNDFYHNEFMKNNIKETWKLIKQNLHNFKENKVDINLKENNHIITDKFEIANVLNNHFVSSEFLKSKLVIQTQKLF